MQQNGLETVRIEPSSSGFAPFSPVPRRRLCIIHNPTAGARRQRRLAAVLAAFRELSCQVELRRTAGAGDGENLAVAAAREGFDAIVVAGGDGTINEVVNGLAAGSPGPGTPPLALVPLGTANVLAAELGTPRNVDAL